MTHWDGCRPGRWDLARRAGGMGQMAAGCETARRSRDRRRCFRPGRACERGKLSHEGTESRASRSLEALALQRLAIYAQDPGRLALVASGQLEHAADVPPLQRGQA